jgi:hypothetical protein
VEVVKTVSMRVGWRWWVLRSMHCRPKLVSNVWADRALLPVTVRASAGWRVQSVVVQWCTVL